MYDAAADPYCYPGTIVLKNIRELRDQPTLDAFEAISTAQRAEEPLPSGRSSVRHYRAIHRHLFQDVYAWAGAYRTVRLSKGNSAFCYPEHIAAEMRALFASLKPDCSLRALRQMPLPSRRPSSSRPLTPFIHSARATDGPRQASSSYSPPKPAIRSILTALTLKPF